jgi:hypothetical protein
MNQFSKEERVAFETLLEGFQDAAVMSKNISVYRMPDVEAERANNIIWRPMPYILPSFDGTDQTTNFNDAAQLSVPATLGFNKSVPWVMSATDLRDALQEGRLGDAAKQKLASDISVAVNRIAAYQGTLVVKRTVAATGFDDVALCDAIFNEQGIPFEDRYLALSTRDYNNMASGLASRGTMNQKPTNAYENAYVGRISGFETFKMDNALRLAAAAGGGGITMSTLDAAAQYYIPQATRTASGGTGETSNVDNRYQQLTWSSTANVVAGDCFTIATVNAVHHITKQDTGQLKTFRVISVDSGTVVTVSPPLITNQVASDAGTQYQNCTIGTKAANSAIVFLNTVAAFANCFWQKDALELIPGRYAVPSDAGVNVMRGKTEQGVELVMQKFYDINTMKTKYRLDTIFGVVNKQPQMSGLILFSQT